MFHGWFSSTKGGVEATRSNPSERWQRDQRKCPFSIFQCGFGSVPELYWSFSQNSAEISTATRLKSIECHQAGYNRWTSEHRNIGTSEPWFWPHAARYPRKTFQNTSVISPSTNSYLGFAHQTVCDLPAFCSLCTFLSLHVFARTDFPFSDRPPFSRKARLAKAKRHPQDGAPGYKLVYEPMKNYSCHHEP